MKMNKHKYLEASYRNMWGAAEIKFDEQFSMDVNNYLWKTMTTREMRAWYILSMYISRG